MVRRLLLEVARLGLSLILLLQHHLLLQARAEECNPVNYLIDYGNLLLSPTTILPASVQVHAYCTEFRYGGGGCNVNAGWTTPDWGLTCRYRDFQNDQRGCECTNYDCGKDSGYCFCASKFDTTRWHCLQRTRPCSVCSMQGGAYFFRQGCGCVACSTSGTPQQIYYRSTAGMQLYNFETQGGCNHAELKDHYACGSGSCHVCPAGASCDGYRATPCAPGYYQNKTGKSSCLPCVVEDNNMYLPPGIDPLSASVCSPTADNGWLVALLPCDECTDTSSWGIASNRKKSAIGTTLQRCPPTRLDFGTWSDGRCRPCNMCSTTFYARPEAADRWCVTDKSQARCALMYNANPNIVNYKCDTTTLGTAADGTPNRACYRIGENVTVGAMPWLGGHRRTLSEYRYVPGSGTDFGLLPFYSPCGEGTAAAFLAAHFAGAYAPRSNDTAQVERLSARAWYKDCDLSTARECGANFYALLAPSADEDGLRVLLECRSCLNGISQRGLGTACMCRPGSANFASMRRDLELQNALTRITGSAPPDEQECVPCFNDIAWLHADGNIYQEALACAGTVNGGPDILPFRRCKGPRQYVERTTNACAMCAAGVANQEGGALLDPLIICAAADILQAAARDELALPPREIPLQNRTGCQRCRPGTHIAIVAGDRRAGTHAYGCVACPDNTFQPLAGQCACRPKRTACPPGQQIAVTYDLFMDALRDYPCEPCAQECGNGQITIVAPQGIGGSMGNNTCNGRGGYFYSCFNGQGSGGGWQFSAGQRLEYPHTDSTDGTVAPGTSAVIAQCRASALPQHSVFVLQAMNAPGAQCYFSCLHGVQPTVALAYHQQMEQYVQTTRVDLEPFLPNSLLSGPQEGGSGLGNTKLESILVPAVWGYADADSNSYTRPQHYGSWTIDESWRVAGTAAANVWQNTFLFDEAFLATFFPGGTHRQPLCLPPEQAYTWACPPGFVPPSIQQAADDGVSCALAARTHLYRIRPPPSLSTLQPEQQLYAVVSPLTSEKASAASAMCVTPLPDLTRFRLNCVRTCLDERVQAALWAMQTESPNNAMWGDRLKWISYFAQSTYWSTFHGYFNPYRIEGGGTRVPLDPVQYYVSSTPPHRHAETTTTTTTTPLLLLLPASTPSIITFAGAPPTTSAAPASTAVITTTATTTTNTGITTIPSGTCSAVATSCSMRAVPFPGGTALMNTFRYSTQDHATGIPSPRSGQLPPEGIAVCVPCDHGNHRYGDSICKRLFLPERYFSNELCQSPPAGTVEITTDLVCIECEPTLPDNLGTLIPLTEIQPSLFLEWWTVRANSARFPQFGDLVNGVPIWNAVRCRYKCAAGYTSNNESPEAYKAKPCVPCVSLANVVCPHTGNQNKSAAPVFLDVAPNALCGSSGNYVPYTSTCSLCENMQQWLSDTGDAPIPKYVFSVGQAPGARNPVLTSSDCLALCNPTVFHTYKAGILDAAPVTQPLPYGLISCKRCDTDLTHSCQGGCAAGHYRNTSLSPNDLSNGGDCRPCTTTPCPQGLFRQACFAGTALRDAECLPCPSEMLRNPPLDEQMPLAPLREARLRAAIAAIAGQKSRRWLSPEDLLQAVPWAPYVQAAHSPHPAQCALACINNHAWINATTGLSPFRVSAVATERSVVMDTPSRFLFCLPCASDYIANDGEPYLYSVWHAANITEALPSAATPGSALHSLTGAGAGDFPGGCYTCPGFGVRAVGARSKAMCELKPGFTDASQGSASIVDLTVTSVFAVGMGTMTDTAAVYTSEPLPSVPVVVAVEEKGGRDSLDRRRRRALLDAASSSTGANTTTSATITIRVVAAVDSTDAGSTATGMPRVQRVLQSIPVVRAPVFAGGDHYTCCNTDNECRLLRGAAYHGLNSGAVVRAPCAPARTTTSSNSNTRRRALLQLTSDFGAAVRSWIANRTGTPPPSACYGGTYKPNFGDSPCYFCPAAASTTAPDYVGASAHKQCACLPGYYGTRLPSRADTNNNGSSAANASLAAALATATTGNATTTTTTTTNLLDRPLQRCTPCPNGTYRSLYQNESACYPCPPRMYTLGIGSPYCYCVPGDYPNSTYDACVPCEANFYCDGNIKAHCPDNSRSAPGAAARGDCVCDPAAYYGDMSLPGAACLPRPPGYVCLNSTGGGTGAVGCGCAAGWTTSTGIGPVSGQKYARCTSPCIKGQFIDLQPHSQNLRACLPCPPNTYATEGTLIGACTPCPIGRGTSGRAGMTAAANCTCLAGISGRGNTTTTATSSGCEGCPRGLYFDLLTKQCLACPAGWSSAPNTIGRINCVCPPGAYASGNDCVPCQLHTFSHSLGLTCTPCPKGCGTDGVGQTSLSQCRCGRI